MDPAYITTGIWHDLGLSLQFLWLLLFFVVIFAGSLLMAFAIIPSLVTTRHLRAETQRMRRPFYLSALAGLAGMVVTFVLASDFVRVLGDFFARWWI